MIVELKIHNTRVSYQRVLIILLSLICLSPPFLFFSQDSLINYKVLHTNFISLALHLVEYLGNWVTSDHLNPFVSLNFISRMNGAPSLFKCGTSTCEELKVTCGICFRQSWLKVSSAPFFKTHFSW